MVQAEEGEEEEAADDDDVFVFDATRLYLAPCADFCRGRLDLDGVDDEAAVRAGLAAGLRLHRFKRSTRLPRVQRTISTLKGLAPTSLLDIGTGRGVFLWPLLDEMPWLSVTCVDVRPDRVAELTDACVTAECASATALPFSKRVFDVVTALEVLEHIEDVAAAAAEIVRVARRFVIVTVPSQPDDNPEHIRLFTKDTLTKLFLDAGAVKVNVDGVRGHFFAVVSV